MVTGAAGDHGLCFGEANKACAVYSFSKYAIKLIPPREGGINFMYESVQPKIRGRTLRKIVIITPLKKSINSEPTKGTIKKA